MRARIIAVLANVLCVMGMFVSTSWGFSFTSPVAGTKIEAGSTVTARLDSEGAWPLIGVLFCAYGKGGEVMGSDFVVVPPYRFTVQIPPEYIGPVTFYAIGRVLGQKTGEPPQAEVKINVTLPISVAAQSLRVDRDQEALYLRLNDQEKLYVYSRYSDNVERDVSSSSTGTTYTTSDEKIAVVDTDGLVTAVAIGQAKITVKNGDKTIVIDVDVKPKKR